MAFPQEIWWLVSKELTARRDFDSLFRCALAGRSLAGIVLPLLYSIHELSPADGDITVGENQKRALLWRSIIASSAGATLYPYCLWIRALFLGDLHSLIEDMARDRVHAGDSALSYKSLRTWFFSAPLQNLYVGSSSNKKRPVMDIDAIVTRVASQLTLFLHRAAADEDKTVALSRLEGYHLPTTILPDLVSRLSRLVSLTVRDGSVLTADVALALRAHCPQFRETSCHYCLGTDADQDLGGFFAGLAPGSLESFTITSANAIGECTLRALSGHAASLRNLALCLEPPGVAALSLLADCRSLQRLSLDGSSLQRWPGWQTELREQLASVAAWLQQCAALTRLDAVLVPSAAVLAEVLASPQVRLSQLRVRLTDVDDGRFYAALGSQTALESLSVQVDNDELALAARQQLVDSVCCCPGLRRLDLVTEVLELGDLERLCASLPLLDDLSFDGDADDSYLPVLAGIPRLKSLNVLAASSFSFGGLRAFVAELASGPAAAGHRGINIFVMRQLAELKFSEHEEAVLHGDVKARLHGSIQIAYDVDPDEAHESDFSD